MKICYFYNYFGLGGSENYSLNLAELAQKDGNEIFFVFNDLNTDLPKNKGFVFKQIVNKGPFDIFSALKLKKYFTENKIEIVHVHYPREQFLVQIAKLLGAKIKLVRSYHRLDRFNIKAKLFEKLLGRYVDAYIAVSEYAKREMIKSGSSEAKIKVILNGVLEINTETHGKNIGFLGRLSTEKGILELSKVWPKDAPTLIIGGEGSDYREISALRKPNILLLGQVSNLTDFFEKISVLVLPSLSEAAPLVILESFSAGVPVVCFNIDALREIVNEKNGALVSVGNYKEVARTALDLLENEKRLFGLSKNAKSEYEKKYNLEKMYSNTAMLYKLIKDH